MTGTKRRISGGHHLARYKTTPWGTAFALSALALASACSTQPSDLGVVECRITLPDDFDVSLIQGLRLVVDGVGDAPLALAATAEATRMSGGQTFTTQTKNDDGDPENEFVVAFTGNVFRARRFQFRLQGLWGAERPFAVRATVLLDGANQATAITTTTVDGEPIRLERGKNVVVELEVRCTPGVSCVGTIPAPVLSGTLPSSPANNNIPRIRGLARADATVRIYATSDCASAAVGGGSGAELATTGIAVTVGDNTTTTFYAIAVDSTGRTSPCSSTGVTYVEDSTPPAIAVRAETTPPSPGPSTRPRVSGTAETGATVEVFRNAACDGVPAATGAAALFASPGLEVDVDDNAATSFGVRAIDTAGNSSLCVVGPIYVADNSAGVPAITDSAPASPTNNNAPRLRGTAEGGTTIRLYRGEACTGAIAAEGTAEGFAADGIAVAVDDDEATTFYAQAVDALGNVSPCSAGFAYIEDSTPPLTPSELATDPASPSREEQLVLSGMVEGGTTVELHRVGDCGDAPFAETRTGGDGRFQFSLFVERNATTTFFTRARDAVLNRSACSPGLAYVNDQTSPRFAGAARATATGGPDAAIDVSWYPATDEVSPSAVLTYEVCQSNDLTSCGSRFVAEAKTDGGAIVQRFDGLRESTRYFFSVRARDEAGNRDSNSAVVSAKTAGPGATTQVSSNLAHACALLSDGTVSCWGNARYGKLGNGITSGTFATPVRVLGVKNALGVSVGRKHTCAVVAGGAAMCWGNNESGQLGLGLTVDETARPVAVDLPDGGGGFIAVAAGERHTCGLLGTGRVACWGDDQSTPRIVEGVSNAIAVTALAGASCALAANGTVACWGAGCLLGNDAGADSAVPSPVVGVRNAVALSGNFRHACALLSDGTARCWGETDGGRLGRSDVGASCARTAVATPGLVGASQISAGRTSTCATLANGRVLCWGANAVGQLGDGTLDASATPVAPVGVSSAVQVSAGQSTFALLANGTLQAWGSAQNGLFACDGGGPCPTPEAGPTVLGVESGTRISGSGDCAVLSTGRVVCGGYDRRVMAPTDAGRSERPLEIPGLGDVKEIGVGHEFACVLLASGRVACWGYNDRGEVGVPDASVVKSPTEVVGVENAVQLAVGREFACAVVAGGRTLCWGNGDHHPREEVAFAAAKKLVAGCALLADGTVKCPGYSSVGPGDGGLGAVKDLAAGGGHTCALIADGTVRCWGESWARQAGTRNSFQETPVTVGGLDGCHVVSIGASIMTSCAACHDGSLRCWGYVPFILPGDPDVGSASQYSATALAIPDGGMTPRSIASSPFGDSTCVLHANGTLSCFGYPYWRSAGVPSTNPYFP